MNPMLISAGVGLLGSLFGGKSPSTPGYVKRNYDLQNSILKRSMDLYDGTDLQAQDAATVAAFGKGVMDRAMTTLGNYDARAAGAGSPMGKSDTQKDRAKAQIAGDAGSQISQVEANLSQTRAARQAALLPNPAQAAAGTQAAAYLDQQGQQQYNAQMEGLAAAAQLIGGLFKKGGAKGRNDLLNLNLGGAMAPGSVAV